MGGGAEYQRITSSRERQGKASKARQGKVVVAAVYCSVTTDPRAEKGVQVAHTHARAHTEPLESELGRSERGRLEGVLMKH